MQGITITYLLHTPQLADILLIICSHRQRLWLNPPLYIEDTKLIDYTASVDIIIVIHSYEGVYITVVHTKFSMISIRVHWNPNDTPDRSSLLSLRLNNAQPLILASNIIIIHNDNKVLMLYL